jgi:hypothetical protein
LLEADSGLEPEELMLYLSVSEETDEQLEDGEEVCLVEADSLREPSIDEFSAEAEDLN